MKQKFINFFKKNKKSLLNMCIALATLITISFLSMLIFMAFDIIYFDDGIKFNTEIFNSFKNSWYGWLVFIGIQILFTILLCFVPGMSMALILLCQTMYERAWQAFAISFISVMISSTVMYLLGRFGGYRVCARILGDEDCEKATKLLKKGSIFFPFMMLFPIFPDDALVMMAGTIKMSPKWFIPSIIIGRGIGIATIIFGLSIVPFDKFTSPWHWVIFVLACAVFVFAVFFLAYKFNKMMNKRAAKKEHETSADNCNTENSSVS